MTIFLICLWLAFIPLIFWSWVYLRMAPEPRKLAVLTFLGGMVSVIPVFIVDFIFDVDAWILSAMSTTWWIVVFSSLYVGYIEELVKHLVVKFVDYKRDEFSRVIDGIQFSIIAALGFSFVENVRFFVIGTEEYGIISMNFVLLFVFRSLVSTLAHTLFSGFYGFYYGRAKLMRESRVDGRRITKRFRSVAKNRAKRWLKIFGKKTISEKTGLLIDEEVLCLEGLMVAMTLHGLFNLTLAYDMVYLVIPFLVLEFAVIMHEFETPENRALIFVKNKKSVHK